MLRILRRYNKIILVFGGCLLMVLFLIPSVGQQGMGMSMSATVARYEGGKITQKDLLEAQRELEVLDIVRFQSLGVSVYSLLGSVVNPELTGGDRGVEGLEHWILLVEQARRAGLVGGPADGNALIETLAIDFARNTGQNPQTLSQEILGARDAAIQTRGEQAVNRALANAHGVMRLVTTYRGFFPMSRPEAISVGRDVFDKVTVDFITIPSTAFIEQVPQPSPERINEFFAANKANAPDAGEYGIGYLRAPALRFEWLTIDHNAIASAISVDPVEVNKFWRQNKAQFGENFSESRATVEREYRSREATQILQRARESAEGKIRLAASSMEKAAGQPALTLKDVQAMITAALPAAPEGQSFTTFNEASEGWMPVSQLGSAPGIGTSALRINERQSLSFSMLVENMAELNAAPNPIVANYSKAVKPTVPYGPLTDASNNLYYFRILEARPQSPPDSVAEIQPLVVEDIRSIDAFEILKSKQEELRLQLAEKGAGSMINDVALSPRMINDVEISRTTVRQRTGALSFPDLDVPEFRNMVMDRVATWDPVADIETIPAADRTFAFPSKARRSLVLLTVKSHTPLTVEAFNSGEFTINNVARNQLREQFADNPFTLERMAKTMKLTGEGEPRKKSEEKSSEPVSAPGNAVEASSSGSAG